MSNNQKDSLVTICIPVYNGSAYISDSLSSALKQTYTNCEILIVDDCSTDNTLEIIQQFEKLNSNIRVHKNDRNLGLVGNWNKCIELARGNWIKFIFQDDTMENSCVEEMVTAAQKYNHEFIVCERSFLIQSDASSSQNEFYTNQVSRLSDFFKTDSIIHHNDFNLVLSKNLTNNFIGEPCSFLFAKSLTNKYGLFCADLSQLCDFEFAARIASNIGLVYVPRKLVQFRVHGNSTSESNHKSKKIKLELIDSYILAYRYRYIKEFRKFRMEFNERILNFYYQRVNNLFDKNWDIGHSLIRPFLIKYPLTYIHVMKAMIKGFLKNLKIG